MRVSERILRINMYMLFSIFIMCSCNTSQRKYTNPQNGNENSVKNETSYSRGNKPRVDTVFIQDMKFQPEVIKVHKGDTVIWINKDLVDHCVTDFQGKTWTSGAISSGLFWKLAVTHSSDYYCAIHQVMKGKIVIK